MNENPKDFLEDFQLVLLHLVLGDRSVHIFAAAKRLAQHYADAGIDVLDVPPWLAVLLSEPIDPDEALEYARIEFYLWAIPEGGRLE